MTVEEPEEDPGADPSPDPDPAAPTQRETVAEPSERHPSPAPPGSSDVPAPPAPQARPAPAPEQAADGQGESPSPAPAPEVPAGVAPEPAPTTADPAPVQTPRSAPAQGPTALWGSGHGAILSVDWLGYLSLSGMTPSAYALEDIPTEMVDLYQAATSVCPGLPWAVLAAVGKVETDHARNVAVSSAGARGPMQFMPATWRAYGMDADGDGSADIDDPADAVFSAASYLCAHGGGEPETLPQALYAYNHAWWYVHGVIGYAQRYVVQAWDPTAPFAPVDRAALLDNPRLTLYPGGRADIAAGRIDPRVLDLLALLTQQHEITVVSLQTGHSMNVAGTNRVSNHFLGRAVDIAAIDGERVSATSPRARALVTWLASLEGPQRPREVGSPFADMRSQPGHFTDAMHMGHVHIGWGTHHHD
ncbi:MAG TPA: lytic murein transglycosylase [Egibacteraceae bacterium]|nr:lytic murein transglycosylase [Egibacteraceae bacterium]